ncbi:MAG: hypothetical protein AB7N65_27785 [Vicinamibacterales bacterium]
MRTAFVRLVIAVLFFAAAAAFVTEARRARQAADVRQQIATLQYARTEFTIGDEEEAPLVQLPIGGLRDDRLHQQTLANYWRSQYEILTDPAGLLAQEGAASDPELLFLAANAAFRVAQNNQADERATNVERLDRVIEDYAAVLRADGNYQDAAFNYEFVVRLRDLLAGTRNAQRIPENLGVPIPSPDLPVGPTIHGYPGGPPGELPGSEFNTIAPMPFEERDANDPGMGQVLRRRG